MNNSQASGALPRPAKLLLLIVWALCAGYAALHLDHRWFPHDEGTLAHAAERVAAGELPHADFDEVYTGGLSFLNAVAFDVFGERLISLRLALYLLFLPWVATLLYIGTRFVAPPAAALAVCAAVAWSIPNYAAALPSWYNLFFATFGAAALLRWNETGRQRWLWVAGLSAGLSIIVKIVGVYFIAAALLYFVYRNSGRPATTPEPVRFRRAYSVFVSAGLLLFVLVVARVVHADNASAFVDFVLPLAALAAVAAGREWRAPPAAFAPRVGALLAAAVPFLAGAAVPVALLLVPYVLSGTVDALLYGVFVLPYKRLDFATLSIPGWFRPLALPALVVAIGLPLLPARPRRIVAVLVTVAAVAALIAGGRDAIYGATFRSMVELLPLALTAAALGLWREDGAAEPSRDGLFLLLALASTWSLVRYPFPGAIYYFYAMPLAIMAIVALAARWSRPRARAVAGVIAFYALFALLWLGPNSLLGIALGRFIPTADDFHPPIERAGIRMTRDEAVQYTFLVRTVEEHTRSRFIYAAPDSPEVYFLTGTLNPTRTFYDFFDDQEGRTGRVLEALERYHVNVVVLKELIPFSGPVPGDLHAAIVARFPNAEEIGIYTVRWRP